MPPTRIILVRHSEREDQINRDFAKTYPRPHDSPLTQRGVDMARKLGGFLAYNYSVLPVDVVVLTSPLVRCVQTSNAIVEGLIRHARREDKKDIPIYLEPSIMEGAFYLLHDMKKNSSVATPTKLHVPQPLIQDVTFLKENYSKYLQINKPFSFNSDPKFSTSDMELTEANFEERNRNGAAALLQTPELDGKTVILLGHGETVKIWYDAFTGEGHKIDFCPPYTAFVVLHREPGTGGKSRWVSDGPVFTQDHLRNPAPIVPEVRRTAGL